MKTLTANHKKLSAKSVGRFLFSVLATLYFCGGNACAVHGLADELAQATNATTNVATNAANAANAVNAATNTMQVAKKAFLGDVYGELSYLSHAKHASEFLRLRQGLGVWGQAISIQPFLEGGAESSFPDSYSNHFLQPHSNAFVGAGLEFQSPYLTWMHLWIEDRGRIGLSGNLSNQLRILTVNDSFLIVPDWVWLNQFHLYGETLLTSKDGSDGPWNLIAMQRLSFERSISVLGSLPDLSPNSMQQSLNFVPEVRGDMIVDRLGHFYNRQVRAGIGFRIQHVVNRFAHSLRFGIDRVAYLLYGSPNGIQDGIPTSLSESNPYLDQKSRFEVLYSVGATW